MKGGYGAAGGGAQPPSSSSAGKRRWKGPSLAVFVLVACSVLVPLSFLRRLHDNRFPAAGYADERSQSETRFEGYKHMVSGNKQNPSEVDESKLIDLISKLTTPIPQDVIKSLAQPEDLQKKINSESNGVYAKTILQPKVTTFLPAPKKIPSMKEVGAGRFKEIIVPLKSSSRNDDIVEMDIAKGIFNEEIQSSCQIEFGSYCLWSRAHKEAMKDSIVKRLKDQLFVARAYYPSVAKLKGKGQMARVMKSNIQEHERILSEAVSDHDLPASVLKNLKEMDETIAKAKSFAVDCQNVDRKLRQLVDLTDDEAHFHMKQSAFLYQLGVQTMSKSFHCLSMRLTVEHFQSSLIENDQSHAHKLVNPSFRHFVVFSKNVLAVSVTINSTVTNSYETDNMVFHVVTDRQNFFSMKHWFFRNFYKEAVVDVLNFDELKHNFFNAMDEKQLLPAEEFRVSFRFISEPLSFQMRTEYISVFGHSYYFLPQIFKNLKRVIVLDDDVVVQRDTSLLWDLDLQGKVNGASNSCSLKLNQLKFYLGNNSYNGNSCVWMSGLNIVDLERWREIGITEIYQRLLNEMKQDSEESLRAATLPASLLAFNGQIYALDDTWVQSRLGHDYGVDADNIKKAMVLHYNGNMKPWLDLAIPKYKKYWKMYLTHQERFMDECNLLEQMSGLKLKDTFKILRGEEVPKADAYEERLNILMVDLQSKS